MDTLISTLKQISDLFFLGEGEQGTALFMQQVGVLGQIPGVAPFVNPLFDALEKGDYFCAADIRILPGIRCHCVHRQQGKENSEENDQDSFHGRPSFLVITCFPAGSLCISLYKCNCGA